MNFRLLPTNQTELLWSTVGKLFGYPNERKMFKLPKPFIRFDVSSKYSYETRELEQVVLQAMNACTTEDELVFAMEWQHDCYEFDPREPIDRNEFGEWLIPIFPNGDYHIFLQKKLEWGVFGHPWKQEIGIFGSCFINNFNTNIAILDTIVQKKTNAR
ncbi:DUF2716 domain-containing protein [Virgibacillus pantothenticus]|jgi:Protein of unknown function (DUF2716)|uniref:DUF2716 domain-containing protein n=1 Tax=Virgibacillus pantothenticus TaxID=1473 RepID=UPI000986E3E6|nr:DUF2716 domain-containing protein [Virgibacillus pantothenticus]